ncbi:hypothetical protein RIVM261_077540 [Rivularia sp. IAM M-261]|nr:hypothetical protein RIVM261_077540 [Rivularia sp. IAM M-261]
MKFDTASSVESRFNFDAVIILRENNEDHNNTRLETMSFEDKYFDVLHNIESTIINTIVVSLDDVRNYIEISSSFVVFG